MNRLDHSAPTQTAREREAIAQLEAESAADLTSQLSAVGLNDRADWITASALFGVTGFVITLLGALSILPGAIEGLGVVSIATGLVCLYGLNHWQNSRRGAHMRTIAGAAIIYSGAYFAGPVAAALMMIGMLNVIAPCFLYGPRFAIPYSIGLFCVMGTVMVFAPGPQTTARAVIYIVVMLAILISMIMSEQRTRALAFRNRRLAYSDPLTGIANTRRLHQALIESLQTYEQEARSFALYSIDLNNFKIVNDVFDHGVGDRVLQAVAGELASELEPRDLVARRGGDEFSVLVVDSGKRDLDDLARRLEAAIIRARTAVCPAITPSGSVAFVEARVGDNLPGILRRADDGLHDVKRAFHDEHGDRDAVDAVEMTAESLMTLRLDDPEHTAKEIGSAGWFSRAIDTVSESNPAWLFAAFVFAPVGFITGTVATLGLLEPLSPLAGAAINSAVVALGVLAYFAGRRDASLRFMHHLFAGIIALFTLQTALAGPAGGSLIDLYCVPMLFAFYCFPPRTAVFYAVASALLFSGFALGAGYLDAVARVVVSMMVMAIAIGIVAKVRSITEGFVRTNRELSQVDALTGVANIRALRSRTTSAIAAVDSGGSRPALISIDLDKFKQVNDRYNHSVGDQVLVAVSRAITETARSEDLIARRGGDEFIVLCGFSDAEELDALVERMSQAITHARIRVCPDLVAGASIGWSAWEIGEDAEAFLQKSNSTLHNTKSESRERTELRAAG
jgi:diguanylate cyclase (GGDEF)-like protein